MERRILVQSTGSDGHGSIQVDADVLHAIAYCSNYFFRHVAGQESLFESPRQRGQRFLFDARIESDQFLKVISLNKGCESLGRNAEPLGDGNTKLGQASRRPGLSAPGGRECGKWAR